MVCIHKTVDTLEKAQVWHKKVRAANEPSAITMTEKVPINRVFSWLKAVFTFKNLLRHYAKQVLTLW